MAKTICTNCKMRTTDGCGPGPVMVCGHPHFKDVHSYEDAIIQWEYINGKKEAVSDECPMLAEDGN